MGLKVSFIEEEKIIRVEPGRDVQEVLTELLVHSGSDFSMNTVVYPGRRPAHYLRLRLAEKLRKAYIPPKIYSMDDFIFDLHSRIFGKRPIEPMDAVTIIYSILKENGLLKDSLLELDNFFPLGERIFSVIEELYIEYVPPSTLKQVDSLINVPYRSLGNIHFLSTVYELFYMEIDKLRLSTRSKRYVEIAECEDLDDHLFCSRLIFCGFFALTEAEKRILSRVSSRPGFLFVYQEEGEITKDGRSIHFYSAPDLHGEAKIVGEIVKKEKKGNVAIVLPRADALFPLLRHGISFLSKDEYNISMGYPLTRTPIYGFFLNLFNLLERCREKRVYVPSYLKFLLHPYTKNIELGGKPELGRTVIHEIEKILKKEVSFAFADLSWIRNELPSMIEKNVDLKEKDIGTYIESIHSNLLEPFFEIENIGDFFKKCHSALLFISRRSTAPYHPLFYPYANAYLTQFEMISSSLLSSHSFEQKTSYFNLFKRLLSSSFFPFEGSPKAPIQILGFLETRNLKFPTVIFLDLNEGTFPDLNEDYLLPHNVRRLLRLPTSKDRERLIFHYFNTLLCGAESVHLLFLENAESTRSRFLEKLIWEMERKKGEILDDMGILSGVNYSVNLSNTSPSPIEKNPKLQRLIEDVTFSPSAIDDYLECGIRFYLRYVLKIKEEKSQEEDLDKTEIGNIVHLSLRRFFEKRVGRYLRPDSLPFSEIKEEVDRIFSQKYGLSIDGKAFLTKRQIEKRLCEYLDYLAKILEKEKIRILNVEEYVEEEFFGVPFSFRIDLVQERNGRVEILDFKTSGDKGKFVLGKKITDHSIEGSSFNLPSLQIPIYILLYAKKYGKNPRELKGRYVLLGSKNLDADSFVDPFEKIDEESGIHTVEEIVKRAIGEIRNPDKPFLPPSNLLLACPFCPYTAFCGTLWVTRY